MTSDGGTGALDQLIANGSSTPTLTAAPGSGVTDTQFVHPGDTVQLAGAPDYTVGPNASSAQTLTVGDVILDDGNLYRYVGTDGLPVDLQNDISANADFQLIGAQGQTYAYIGSSASSIDLNSANYTDTTTWSVPKAYSDVPTSGATNTQTLNPGDRVSVKSGYDTPAYTVGTTPATNSSVTLNAGDVIANSSTCTATWGPGDSLRPHHQLEDHDRHDGLQANRRRRRADLRLYRGGQFLPSICITRITPIRPSGVSPQPTAPRQRPAS